MTLAAAELQTAIDELRSMFKDRLSTSTGVRDHHSKDESWHHPHRPDAVVFPNSTEEVAEIVRICARHNTPVVAYGTGTSLEGNVIPHQGGVVVDLANMNQVLRVNAEDLDVTVQARVTRKELNAHIRDQGLFFPIDPGADASLGGMAATRASGTNAVRYGTMRENVLALTVVLADGRIIRTSRRARKSAAGYDLTRLRRLRRHAWHHHRSDAAPLRHPGGDGCGGVLLREHRRRGQNRDPDHPARHSGGAH